MPRSRKLQGGASAPAVPAPPPSAPHVIDPDAVYSVEEFQRALKLRASTARREFREGRLRVARRAGKNYILGEWILEWLRGGELPRRRKAAAARQRRA